jgi:uncharacterized protein YndB with AHSA1/START domain
MTTRNSTATAEEQKTLNLERTFNLPLTTVWKAFSDAETLKKWWGPKEYTCPDCSIDFTEGGKFLASMQGEDGKKIWSTGTYKEIVPMKRIVNTDNFSDSKGNIVPASEYGMPGEWTEGLVTVEFEEVDGKTNIQLQHEGLPEEMIDDCRKGWESSFDKLEENVR